VSKCSSAFLSCFRELDRYRIVAGTPSLPLLCRGSSVANLVFRAAQAAKDGVIFS